MEKFISENMVFRDSLFLLLFIAAAAILEIVRLIRENDSKIIKRYSVGIIVCYIVEFVMFLIPMENTLIDVICTIFGIGLFYSYYCRWKENR